MDMIPTETTPGVCVSPSRPIPMCRPYAAGHHRYVLDVDDVLDVLATVGWLVLLVLFVVAQ